MRRGIAVLEILGIIWLVGVGVKLALFVAGKRQHCQWVERPAIEGQMETKQAKLPSEEVCR